MTPEVLRAVTPPLAGAAVAFAVIGVAWAASRGGHHRADRIGAAAVAIGYTAGYQLVTGGGWHPEHPVSWTPLIAVILAVLGPRLAARVAPGVTVGVLPQAAVLLLSLGGGIAATLGGKGEIGALELAVFGAAAGSAAAARLAPAEGETAPYADARPATWIVAAALVGLIPALA